MLVERSIDGFSYMIDPHRGNAVFLEPHVAEILGDKATDVNAIMDFIYDHKNGEKRLPLLCMWELTNACNFNCPFCFIHNSNPEYQQFDEVIKTIDQMVSAGLFMCTLTGGEVLLHPQFEEIYTYMKEKGIIVEVYSNLSLLQERHIQLFSKFKPYKLEVTLYGHDRKSYYNNTLQKHYGFSDVFSNVLKLKQAGVNVVCKTTATKDTYASIEPISDICDSNGIPYYYSFNIHSDYYGNNKKEYELPLDTKQELLLKRAQRNGQFVPEKYEIKPSLFCSGSKYGSYISYDFSFRMCHQAYRVSRLNVDLKAHSVETALHIIDKTVQNYASKTISFCQGCVASNYCKHCLVDDMEAELFSDYTPFLQKCGEYQELFAYVRKRI